MDTPKMTAMGMKRADMYESDGPATPKSEKDYKNELIYPNLHATGKQAEMLGAETLDDGEYVKQLVVWRVKKTTIERDGKKEYTLDFDLVKASDPEHVDQADAGGDSDKAAESDEADDGDDDVSPGLSFILSGKGKS